MHCGYFDTTRKRNHSNFLTATVVSGRRPLPSEVFAQTDPPVRKKLPDEANDCAVSLQ